MDRKHPLIRRYHVSDAATHDSRAVDALLTRGKPLTGQASKSNRTKSSVRVRLGHIFGAQAVEPGGVLVRTIGLVRAKARIGTLNIVTNMRRPGQLRRLDPCPA